MEWTTMPWCPSDVAPFYAIDFSLTDVNGWKSVVPEGVTSIGLLCIDVYQDIIDLTIKNSSFFFLKKKSYPWTFLFRKKS